MAQVVQSNPLYNTNSYFSAFLYYKSWNPNYYDFNSSWVQSWKSLSNGELFGRSVATADPNGLFHTLVKNRQAVQAVSASTTLNADGTLTVTFTDATYSTFRLQQKVSDGNMYEGYVVATGAGFITISPLNNPTTFVAATHFKVNSIITARGKLAGLHNSTGTTSIYDTKDEQEDYLEITRDSQQIDMLEKTYYFAAEVGGEKKVYGYKEAEGDMVNHFLMSVMFKKFFGKGGAGLTTLEGAANKTYGIRNRIIDNSGNYLSGTSPMTNNQFKQILFACRDANPTAQQDILLLPGVRALDNLSTFYPTQLGYAGGQIQNGDQMGITLDVRKVNLAGMNVSVAMNWEMLNDSVNLPDWMKDSIFFINRSQLVINGQKRSMVTPFHFSQNSNSDYRPIYRCVPGMVGAGDTDDTGLATLMGNYQLTANSVAGASCEALDASGVAMIPYGHGLFEYIH